MLYEAILALYRKHTPADFIRNGVIAHNLTSFVINNIVTTFKDRRKDMKTFKDLSDQVVAEIGRVFRFNYLYHGRVTRNSSLGDYDDLRYLCNQYTGGKERNPRSMIL